METTMKIVIGLLLLLLSLDLRADSVHVGRVAAVSKSNIQLDRDGAVSYIGFVGDASALRSLKRIKVGNEVRAVFGTARDKASGHAINKLISIRTCLPHDPECEADRKKEAMLDAVQEKASDEYVKSIDACLQKVALTLEHDPRYVPEDKLVQVRTGDSRYRAMSAAARTCVDRKLREHVAAYLEACELHHCGDNVGGGCDHFAGYSVTTSANEKALEQCGKRGLDAPR